MWGCSISFPFIIDPVSSSSASVPLTPGSEADVFNMAVADEKRNEHKIIKTFLCFDEDVGMSK